MRKMGKVAMALVVAVLALSMMACNPSGGQTVPEDVGQGIVDVQYAIDYGGLLSTLNGYAKDDLASFEVGAADQPFAPMGAEIGTVTVTRYESDKDYAYSAKFNKVENVESEPLLGMTAQISVTAEMNVEYSIKDDVVSYSADVPEGGSKLTVAVLGTNLMEGNFIADLKMNEDGSAVVGDRSYSSADVQKYLSLSESLTSAKNEYTSQKPATLGGEGKNYSFTLDDTADETVSYTGTINANGTEYNVNFSVKIEGLLGNKSFEALSINGSAISASIVDIINNPYINNPFA